MYVFRLLKVHGSRGGIFSALQFAGRLPFRPGASKAIVAMTCNTTIEDRDDSGEVGGCSVVCCTSSGFSTSSAEQVNSERFSSTVECPNSKAMYGIHKYIADRELDVSAKQLNGLIN